jgi:hypothetical protein
VNPEGKSVGNMVKGGLGLRLKGREMEVLRRMCEYCLLSEDVFINKARPAYLCNVCAHFST